MKFDWFKPVIKQNKEKGINTDFNKTVKKKKTIYKHVNDKGVPDIPEIRAEIAKIMRKNRRGL